MTSRSTKRWAYSCDRCSEWTFVDRLASERPIDGRSALCPVCGGAGLRLRGAVEHGKVVATYQATPCDARCTDARGTRCDCSCGGENHGSHRVVTVRQLLGEEALLAERAERMKRRMSEIAPLLDEAEQLKNRIAEILELRYADVLAKYRAGRYLVGAEWTRYLDFRDLRRELRRRAEYKQPKRRVEALREYALQFPEYANGAEEVA
jgi:hypothetical protein